MEQGKWEQFRPGDSACVVTIESGIHLHQTRVYTQREGRGPASLAHSLFRKISPFARWQQSLPDQGAAKSTRRPAALKAGNKLCEEKRLSAFTRGGRRESSQRCITRPPARPILEIHRPVWVVTERVRRSRRWGGWTHRRIPLHATSLNDTARGGSIQTTPGYTRRRQ